VNFSVSKYSADALSPKIPGELREPIKNEKRVQKYVLLDKFFAGFLN